MTPCTTGLQCRIRPPPCSNKETHRSKHRQPWLTHPDLRPIYARHPGKTAQIARMSLCPPQDGTAQESLSTTG